MKKRHIIMQPESVLGILDDRKTMTRRVMKVQPPEWAEKVEYAKMARRWEYGGNEGGFFIFAPPSIFGQSEIKCPYGQPGDELYVKESWHTAKCCDHLSATQIADQAKDVGFIEPPYGPLWYSSDNSYKAWGDSDITPIEKNGFGGPGRKRSSLFMPHWASRITLRIKSVRVERVQEISEEDAKAEGVQEFDSERFESEPDLSVCPLCGGSELYTDFSPSLGALPDTDCTQCDTYKKRFGHLWNSINAAPKPVKTKGVVTHYVSYPWEDIQETREHRGLPWHVIGNPRVWVVGFEEIQ